MSDLAALVKLDVSVEKNLDVLEQFAAIDLTAAEKTGKFRDAFMAAVAMGRLRDLLSGKAMEYIGALKNTRIGFLTDEPSRIAKGRPAYPMDTVRDCVIEAVLRGARLVGNEFNLIAGNAYFTKSFFARKLLEYPGLTDLKVTYGRPVFIPNSSGAVIETTATWNLNGKAMTRTDEHQIRVNDGQGADAVKGKAERKAKAMIYWQLTGTMHADGDISEVDAATPVHGTVVEAGVGGPSLNASTSVATDEPKKAELPPPAVVATPVPAAEPAAESARPRRKKAEAAAPAAPAAAVAAAPAAPAAAVAAAPVAAAPVAAAPVAAAPVAAAPVAAAPVAAAPVAAAPVAAGNFIHPADEPEDPRYKGQTAAQFILRYRKDIEEKADISSEILTARANFAWANVGDDDARNKMLEMLGMKSIDDLKKNRTLQTMKGLIISAATVLEEKGLFSNG
jgi:hypothetical protein